VPALFITASSLGDNTLLAAQTAKKITVKSFQLFNGAATANTVKFRSGTTDISLPVTLPASAVGLRVGLTAPGSQFLFETVAGALLALNLSAATAIGGVLFYELN